tara:strand:- start:5329 stop:6324 length:996 start_codon:yes stop_codon:yes gene_type:complete
MSPTHRLCCCQAGGPAAFIIIGPDEDGWADYSDTLDLGNCNPFCMMDEDVIHPVVDVEKYKIPASNPYIFYEQDTDGNEVAKVRIGLELFLRPKCRADEWYCEGNCPNSDWPNPGVPPGGGRQLPQCYDLPFERFDYTRPNDTPPCDPCDNPCLSDGSWEAAAQYAFDLIHERYGDQVWGSRDDGSPIINPFPQQIWFNIDTSGSHQWHEGQPLIERLYNLFRDAYGDEVAQFKFNPCLDGPNCISWGCCEQEDCPNSPCYTYGGDDWLRRFTWAMNDENLMSSTIDLMRTHFFETHCSEDKLNACGATNCWSCSQCDQFLPCRECMDLAD